MAADVQLIAGPHVMSMLHTVIIKLYLSYFEPCSALHVNCRCHFRMRYIRICFS